MYVANTTTTLAQALNPGDLTIVLNSSANWINTNNFADGRDRSITFWNYTNSFGGTYPFSTNPYSRSRFANVWDAGAISGNTITLRNPWAGGSFAAGTPCSNGNAGSAYKYIAINIGVVPTTFTLYSGTIGGVDLTGAGVTNAFPPGTAYCRLQFFVNGATTYDVSSISFGEDYSSLSRYTPTSDVDSTNTSSGSIVTPGGVGIAKSLFVGGSRVNLANLPTTEPAAVGDLWRDGNTIKVKT
jgi:hypothetical protein